MMCKILQQYFQYSFFSTRLVPKSYLDHLNKISTEYDMIIHIKNTKTMKIGRKETAVKVTKDGKEIEKVEKFGYFESMITNGVKCYTEIKRRIAMGKHAFYKRKELMREFQAK